MSKQKCSRCGRRTEQKNLFVIDDAPICVKCLYGDADPLAVYPIGIVRSGFKRARKGFGVVGDSDTSRIELFASQKPFLYKLEEEKNVMVLYYFHEARPVRSIFNRGLDGKKVGVFASRTPDRLSRIGVQDVSLVKIEGTTLYVKGLDAVDGSPVLDIKLKWSSLSD